MGAVRQNWMVWASAGMAMLTILTTGLYTLHSFTGVPYWDMFDGTLWLETRFSQGDWGALWDQHNEHRIVLAKLLFLLDLQIADGTTPFLHILNLLLAGATAWVLLLFSHSIVGGQRLSVLNMLIVALSFSILQEQNFVDAFQSQFFLSSLLPLLSLYFAHLSLQDIPNSRIQFILATICAVMSILSMANGVFALPVLLIYSILMRMNWRRIAALSVLSIIGFLVYFYGYHRISAHSSPFEEMKNPLGLFLFVCAYMGHSVVLGFVVITSAVVAFGYYLPKRRFHSAEVALLGFVGFVLLTGTITAMGRVSLGPSQPYASRYLTPVFSCLSALLILYRPLLLGGSSVSLWRSANVWRWVGILSMIFVLSEQKTSLRWVPERNFSHLLGALALELGLADQDTVGAIYPDAAHALTTSKRARTTPEMIWAMAPIKDSKLLIGSKIKARSATQCKLAVDKVTHHVANSQMQRLDGWIGLPADQMIYLTDEAGTVFGIGLVGRSREDVAKVFPEVGNRTGFTIYAVESLPKSLLFLGTESRRCKLSVVE